MEKTKNSDSFFDILDNFNIESESHLTNLDLNQSHHNEIDKIAQVLFDKSNNLNSSFDVTNENKLKNSKKETNSGSYYLGHRDRARQRFSSLTNKDAFSDYDLMELILFFIIPRVDVKETAYKLIKKFKDIRGVFQANKDELHSIIGYADKINYFFQIANEVSTRICKKNLKNTSVIDNFDVLLNYVKKKLSPLQIEEFWIIFLNSNFELIDERKFGTGTLDESIISKNDILKSCIELNIKNIVLMHNHPSGSAEPSISDITATNSLLEVLSHINVSIIDHIIVAHDDYFSFAKNDLLQNK